MSENVNYTRFDKLGRAFAAEQVALVECTDKQTGAKVNTICITHDLGNGQVSIQPIAKMFDGDPFEELNPPGVQNEKTKN